MTQIIKIGDRLIGDGQPVFICAEAGVNHCGRVDLALQMVDAAKQAGADAVKFQVIYPERYISRVAPLAEYMQRANDARQESQLDLLKRLTLTDDEFRIVKAHCDECGIMFLATPFDETAADFLDSIGVLAFKIPSGEIDNLRYLRHIARRGKPMIMSTGMATLGEVETALLAMDEQRPRVALLHCTSNYPASIYDANLQAIDTMWRAFRMPIGYSDHTSGFLCAVMSVGFRACIIEKHFTLDRDLPGPDQRASLTPDMLADYVTIIHDAEYTIGNGFKEPSDSELSTRDVARKSIVAVRDIMPGERLADDMLTMKRPGTGLPFGAWQYIIGRTVMRRIGTDSLVSLGDLA